MVVISNAYFADRDLQPRFDPFRDTTSPTWIEVVFAWISIAERVDKTRYEDKFLLVTERPTLSRFEGNDTCTVH